MKCWYSDDQLSKSHSCSVIIVSWTFFTHIISINNCGAIDTSHMIVRSLWNKTYFNDVCKIKIFSLTREPTVIGILSLQFRHYNMPYTYGGVYLAWGHGHLTVYNRELVVAGSEEFWNQSKSLRSWHFACQWHVLNDGINVHVCRNVWQC